MANKRWTVSLSGEPAYIPDEDAIYLSDEFGAKCWQGYAIEKLAWYEDISEIRGDWNVSYRAGHSPLNGSVCSICDCWSSHKSKYCPNCGTKMNYEDT